MLLRSGVVTELREFECVRASWPALSHKSWVGILLQRPQLWKAKSVLPEAESAGSVISFGVAERDCPVNIDSRRLRGCWIVEVLFSSVSCQRLPHSVVERKLLPKSCARGGGVSH